MNYNLPRCEGVAERTLSLHNISIPIYKGVKQPDKILFREQKRCVKIIQKPCLSVFIFSYISTGVI